MPCKLNINDTCHTEGFRGAMFTKLPRDVGDGTCPGYEKILIIKAKINKKCAAKSCDVRAFYLLH